MVSSVVNEGLRGMQYSQREMNKSAQDIARANIPEQQVGAQAIGANEQTTLPPVQEAEKSAAKPSITESLVELRKQEHLFNANAKVVSVGNQTMGSLLDVIS